MSYVVSVASSAYNMAGDIKKRPNVLEATVLQALGNTSRKKTVGNHIVNSYLSGSGISLRNYANWCSSSGYSEFIGQPTTSLFTVSTLDNSVINTYIEAPEHYVASISHASIETNNILPEAIEYIKANKPQLIDSQWESDLVNDNIVITYEDGTSDVIPYNATPSDQHLVGTYDLTGSNFIDQSTMVTTTSVVTEYEDTSEYPDYPTNETNNTATDLVNYTKVTKQYSDGSPDSVTTTVNSTVNTPYSNSYNTYTKETVVSDTATNKSSWFKVRKDIWEYNLITNLVSSTTTTYDEGGVTVTEITEEFQEVLEQELRTQVKEYLYYYLHIIKDNWFTYKYGSGNAALDAQMDSGISQDLGNFFPIVPLRINGVSVKDTTFPTLYPQVKKALRKQTGRITAYDSLIESLEDNESIGDIDYAYNVIGVSLNTEDNSCRNYLFEFFKSLYIFTLSTSATFDKVIRIKADNLNINYNMEIKWSSIVFTTGSGSYNTTIKNKDVIVDGLYFAPVSGGGLFGMLDRKSWHTEFKLVKQYKDYWEAYEINDLVHTNNIYKGKQVIITALDALSDEEESGFIIPLSIDLFKSMNLVEATQLTVGTSYLVINAYAERKKKWYENELFQVVLVIGGIALAVFTGGIVAGGMGILGTNISVGVAIGLSGTLAVIAGAAINALAGMLVAKIIANASIKLFGDELGTIIAGLANLGLGMYLSGATLATLFNPTTLLKLTEIAAGSYQAYLRGKLKEQQQEYALSVKKYEETMKLIDSKLDEFNGDRSNAEAYLSNKDIGSNTVYLETLDDMLRRTSLTGSDIVELSLDYVYKFIDINEARFSNVQ